MIKIVTIKYYDEIKNLPGVRETRSHLRLKDVVIWSKIAEQSLIKKYPSRRIPIETTISPPFERFSKEEWIGKTINLSKVGVNYIYRGLVVDPLDCLREIKRELKEE